MNIASFALWPDEEMAAASNLKAFMDAEEFAGYETLLERSESDPAAIDAKRKAAGDVSNGLSEIWLPFVDAYRTLCVCPPPDVRQVLDDIRQLRTAA